MPFALLFCPSALVCLTVHRRRRIGPRTDRFISTPQAANAIPAPRIHTMYSVSYVRSTYICTYTYYVCNTPQAPARSPRRYVRSMYIGTCWNWHSAARPVHTLLWLSFWADCCPAIYGSCHVHTTYYEASLSRRLQHGHVPPW